MPQDNRSFRGVRSGKSYSVESSHEPSGIILQVYASTNLMLPFNQWTNLGVTDVSEKWRSPSLYPLTYGRTRR
jgi:hypothetical protein